MGKRGLDVTSAIVVVYRAARRTGRRLRRNAGAVQARSRLVLDRFNNTRFKITLAELGAGAAILTCLVLVLGLGEVGKLRQPDAATAEPMAAVRSPAIAPELVMQAFAMLEPAWTEQASALAPAPAPDLPASVPAAPADATAAVFGIWVSDRSSCSLREFRQGVLPAIISMDGAWAGDTFCAFRDHTPTDNGWRVVATCANGERQWTTPVNLSAKGDRLTWTSKRGTQVYTRCRPDFLVAGAR
jgi:hypothetical protein